MRIRDLLYETWSALAANKGRSFLTILGIVIGIAAVIAMVSLIGGVKQSLVGELGLDQSRMVMIDLYTGQENTFEDLAGIEENVDGYDYVAGAQWSSSTVSTGTKQQQSTVMGVGEHFFDAMGMTLKEGRLLTDDELASGSMSVVIDSYLSRELFGADEQAAGKRVTIGNDEYVVVGVVESASLLVNQGSAYIPFPTCVARISGYASVDTIVGFATEDADMATLGERTESYLRERYGISEEDDESGLGYVYVQTMQSLLDEVNATMMSFQLMMTAVASISLLVGGIGIMNMMLTNVTERIREIGLRKALGARNADITKQFLIESIALCLIGGIIGILVGYGSALALSGVASSLAEGMTVTPYFSLRDMLIVAGICTGIGVVFGYGPARRAAKLDPVESLHYQ
ncbi:Macrolide export ATP-binding/permease protein MacB [Slackia heliotrinireducens]|uniref:ABC transporter permease n=1 Tax=Slackia heliotrinireducens TaxID=84110 RepID=UPI0001A35299|nr:ABC transporter permease [Slackia heliotrinireducens]VEH02162.1 Macrolide export ATP-binding/permease protein MacB [Slackia heliotrinireducens]